MQPFACNWRSQWLMCNMVAWWRKDTACFRIILSWLGYHTVSTRQSHDFVFSSETLNPEETWVGLLSQFHPFQYFPILQNYRNNIHLLNITFIFDRCHCSLAAVAPVKHECFSCNSTYCKIKFIPSGKINAKDPSYQYQWHLHWNWTQEYHPKVPIF